MSDPVVRDRPAASANRAAVAAAGLGILSLPGALTILLGILLGMAAVIIGFYGVAVAKRMDEAGQGLAVTGIVTGMFGLALGAGAGMFLS